jgi:hypothetical protein
MKTGDTLVVRRFFFVTGDKVAESSDGLRLFDDDDDAAADGFA